MARLVLHTFAEVTFRGISMCTKTDCPIFDTCDKEADQSYYCRKIEILLHLSRCKRPPTPKRRYVLVPAHLEMH